MKEGEFLKIRAERFLELAKEAYKREFMINDLNIAYIESRYLPAQFLKEQIDKMFAFVEELLKLLKING